MRDDSVVTALVTRARNGDTQAWHALVERYAPLIWSICRRYRLGDADAQDVSQDVWLHLVRHLDTLRAPAALPGWLATTTRRACDRKVRSTADSSSPISEPQRPIRNCWKPNGTPRCAKRSPPCRPPGDS